MSKESSRALLLSGPQYWDERNLAASPLWRDFEYINPLGIAIVSRFLRNHGVSEINWQTMQPGRIADLESYIEWAGAVFISARHFDTSLAQETITIANKHHKPIIVGGYGPTFNPGAFAGAAKVRGEAEPILDLVIDDFLSGWIKDGDEYNATSYPPFDLDKDYVWPDRSIFGENGPRIRTFRKTPQEWQRGCVNNCSYCSSTRMQSPREKTVRTRRVSDIIAEIETIGLDRGDSLFSVDLNTSAINEEILYELFTYLKQKGIKWYTEGTTAPLIDNLQRVGYDRSLLRLMSALDGKGGCYSFLYGADDLAREKVAGSKDKRVAELADSVQVFKEIGTPITLSVMIGLDNHQYPDSFFEIARVLKEVKAPYAFIQIATPYQGTPWGEQVYKKGRVFDEESTHYNHHKVVAYPKNMEVKELEQGYYWLYKRLYGPAEIARHARYNSSLERFFANPSLGIIQTGLPWSIIAYLKIRELEARGCLDPKVQKELDKSFKDWKSRSAVV